MRILRNVLVDDNYLKTGGGRESKGGGIGSSPKTVGVLKKIRLQTNTLSNVELGKVKVQMNYKRGKHFN